jgi:squalene-associated FAD-dependent desaturase
MTFAGPGVGTGPRIAIIGAGWSGLACAIELVRQQAPPVTLIDAAAGAGGRARRVWLRVGAELLPLDNGQHLLLGAYRSTLALMETVGLSPGDLFHEIPFELRYPDGFALVAGRAPAPFHLLGALLGARGLALPERAKMVTWVGRQRLRRWQLARDHPAAALFDGHPERCVDRIWNPLCLAALNVPLATASAQVFLNVLRDSLGASSSASRFLLPHCDLSALLPDAACAFIARAGATLAWRTPVLGLVARDGGRAGWTVRLRDRELEADQVVLAVPPERAAALLASTGVAALEPAIAALRAIKSAPIATIYLRYPPAFRLGHPLLALAADPGRNWHGQFVFDRGSLDPRVAGVLAVIVSGSGAHQALSQQELAAAAPRPAPAALGIGAPIAHAVVVDRRATIVPSPGLARPATRLMAPGLYLAADAAANPYPSTIEGSVRSGAAAAAAVRADLRADLRA